MSTHSSYHIPHAQLNMRRQVRKIVGKRRRGYVQWSQEGQNLGSVEMRDLVYVLTTQFNARVQVLDAALLSLDDYDFARPNHELGIYFATRHGGGDNDDDTRTTTITTGRISFTPLSASAVATPCWRVQHIDNT